MRLRQVALVARDLDPVVDDICAVLGTEVSFRDPGVAAFGLHNAVIAIGDTFLEVVSPIQANTTASRFLDRRGGDGGYMVMVQADDLDADCKRIADLGVRIVWSIDLDDIRGRHVHPRDIGGAILSLDQPVPEGEWRWAGPKWKDNVGDGRAVEIVGVELQAREPKPLVQRWAEVLGRKSREDSAGDWIDLDRGGIRIVAAANGRGDGVSGFDVKVGDSEAVLSAARRRGLGAGEDSFEVCGARVYLVK